MKKVLVFDDEPAVQSQWREALKEMPSFTEHFEVETRGIGDLKRAIDGLEERRLAARNGSDSTVWSDSNLLDEVDVFFIDFDLLLLHETGENVSYLARCYSRCGLIVAVNQYGDNTFDLTLQGHPESFADLNVGSAQLMNYGLWRETWLDAEGPGPFRPWVWPLIPSAVEALERRTRDVAENLDERILEFLRFPRELSLVLPRTTAEFIQAGVRIEDTTFRSFVESSGQGLRRKDKAGDEALARIAASRIAKWLERLVLAGQDVLVDAPHLVQRLPGLLSAEPANSLEGWNLAARLSNPALDESRISEFRFEKEAWLSRPAWFWRGLTNSELVDELSENAEGSGPGFVFCEDRSRFRKPEESRGFVAAVESPFSRRFVGNPQEPGVAYRPLVRFSI